MQNNLAQLIEENGIEWWPFFPHDLTLLGEIAWILDNYQLPNFDHHSPNGKLVIQTYPAINRAAIKFEDYTPLDFGITAQMFELLNQWKKPSEVIPPSAMI